MIYWIYKSTGSNIARNYSEHSALFKQHGVANMALFAVTCVRFVLAPCLGFKGTIAEVLLEKRKSKGCLSLFPVTRRF